ncbi:MAG: pseudouridine synthase [Candidatus Rifleibacteriota bacterium]
MLEQGSIIYRDEFFVAVNKPAGLLVHPSFLDRHESECAMKQLRDLLGQWVYPVHRLDRPTSGVLIFALSSEAASLLCDEFFQHEAQKSYLALVRGHTEDEGLIDHPLKEIWDKMTDRKVKKDKPAQEAQTSYKTLNRVELPIAVRPHPTSRYSLVEAQPLTGRQRQIRRHFKSIFHPIIGDPKHGDGWHNRMLAEKFGLSRLMLHSWQLAFRHPITKATVSIKADPPVEFVSLLEKIGISCDFLTE